jgi:AAHS family 4-hydroxybenzoate transporter-like MFS transporter
MKETKTEATSVSNEENPISEVLLDKIGHGRYQNFIYLISFIVYMAEGAELIVVSLLNYVLQFVVWFDSFDQVSIMGSMVFLGSMIGSLVAGPVSDTYGRKYPLILSVLVSGVSGVWSALVPNLFWLIVSRGFFGVTFGFMNPIGSALLSEITGR